MSCTFLGEPAFSKNVQQFHRALSEHCRKGAKVLCDPAEIEDSLISMHLECLLNFTKGF